MHPDRVVALHHHITGRFGVTPPQADVPEHIAAGMDGRRGGGSLRVGQRIEHLVIHLHRLGSGQGRTEPLGRHGSHRFPGVADHIGGEHRLVAHRDPEGGTSGHVGGGDRRHHAGSTEGGRQIHTPNPSVGVRAANRHAPQHPLCSQIR